MMNDLEQFVYSRESTDVLALSREASNHFGKFIPGSAIAKILAKHARSDNVRRAKTTASTTLDDKVSVIEDVSKKLLDQFNAEDLDMKHRIEAVKELRQWVKLGTDLAGIHDEESDTLFVVDSEWDVGPRAVN